MSKTYLIFLDEDVIHQKISYHQPRITLAHAVMEVQVDDSILPVSKKDWQIAPVLYKVLSVNRNAGTLTLQLETLYNHSFIPPQFAPNVSPRIMPTESKISPSEFEQMVNAMGGKRMEELVLLDHIHRYITDRGYYFSPETLANYHVCLKTRPFVILAGLSGTGKSKLSQLYAEALGHEDRYLRLPVSPSWNDDHALLGYFDTLTKDYITGPATEFLQRANADQGNLYFFCLDEMNLAHVEYYFSQFLSAMEEEQSNKREIILMSNKEHSMIKHEKTDKYEPVSQRLRIPTNLFFTGTINVDETTHPISDKVIDRANTLEFFTVDLDKIPQPSTWPDPVMLSTITWQSYQRHEPDQSFRPQIIEIGKILNKADLGLGYRVLRDIELYMANSQGVLDPVVAFDLQVKQRILPRVRGTEVISSTVESLLTFFKQNKLGCSEQRLSEMKSRLKRDGYTSFWR